MNVSTDQFWDAMCDPRFIRLSLRSGAIGDEIIETDIAPDEADGFNSKTAAEIVDMLFGK